MKGMLIIALMVAGLVVVNPLILGSEATKITVVPKQVQPAGSSQTQDGDTDQEEKGDLDEDEESEDEEGDK